MSGETPLQNAKHLHRQILLNVTKGAARLREARSEGIAHMSVATILGGGLVLIFDEEQKFRFSAAFDKRVAKATTEIITRWNRQVKPGRDHQVRMTTLEAALIETIVSAATLLVDIESRIDIFEEKEAGL